MTTTAKIIAIDITISTHQTKKSAVLRGCAYIDSGFLIGSIECRHGAKLARAEQVLLSAFTFTGCPVAARSVNSAANPWAITDGTYEGTRVLEGVGFGVRSQIAAVSDDSGIQMSLSVDCSGTLPDLVGIASPFQESIRQLRRGALGGTFSIPFAVAGSKPYWMTAESLYSLDIDTDVAPAWRNITILTNFENSACTQTEQIDLFADAALAETDINNKQRVASTLESIQCGVRAVMVDLP